MNTDVLSLDSRNNPHSNEVCRFSFVEFGDEYEPDKPAAIVSGFVSSPEEASRLPQLNQYLAQRNAPATTKTFVNVWHCSIEKGQSIPSQLPRASALNRNAADLLELPQVEVLTGRTFYVPYCAH